MKFTKYLGAVLFAGMLSACGDDYLEPIESGVIMPGEMEEATKDNPEKVLAAQLDGVYGLLNRTSGVNSDDINSHMSVGLPGIQMLSNNMSNDISLSMDGDPWHFDKQLEYYGEQYVRSGWPWRVFYTVISAANDMIPTAEVATNTLAGRGALGQALALRAFSYFNLAQFYQDTYVTSKKKPCVILRLSQNETSNTTVRATVEQVYAQIEKDLLRAIELLEGWTRDSKSQIDQSVAQGMLSRVYLTMHKWSKAIELAQAARVAYPLMNANAAYSYNYQDVTNSEVMWGVDITTSTSMIYASFQSWMCAQGYGYGGQVGAIQLIDAKLYNSIPDNSIHKLLFVGPDQIYPCDGWDIPAYGNLKFKLKGAEEWLGDNIYMRSAEMYLTEAEALVRLGRVDEAFNVLRQYMDNRLYDHDGDGKILWEESTATIELVQNLRRVELWGEGHSYFDHRRWQFDMDRGYEGSNENRTAWPIQPGYSKGFVPWYHFAWRFQLPLKEYQENPELHPDSQNVIGEEGNQDPVADKITDWSEK